MDNSFHLAAFRAKIIGAALHRRAFRECPELRPGMRPLPRSNAVAGSLASAAGRARAHVHAIANIFGMFPFRFDGAGATLATAPPSRPSNAGNNPGFLPAAPVPLVASDAVGGTD